MRATEVIRESNEFIVDLFSIDINDMSYFLNLFMNLIHMTLYAIILRIFFNFSHSFVICHLEKVILNPLSQNLCYTQLNS
jgi:hypothetical protein